MIKLEGTQSSGHGIGVCERPDENGHVVVLIGTGQSTALTRLTMPVEEAQLLVAALVRAIGACNTDPIKRYDVLYDYAKDTGKDYNELAVMVKRALGTYVEPVIEEPEPAPVPPTPEEVKYWGTDAPSPINPNAKVRLDADRAMTKSQRLNRSRLQEADPRYVEDGKPEDDKPVPDWANGEGLTR